MEPSGIIRPQIPRKQDSGHTRTQRFLDRSVRKLDFSTESSSPRHFVGERGTPKRHDSHWNLVAIRNSDPTIRLSAVDSAFEGGLAQSAAMIGGQAASEQAVNVTTPVHHPPIENRSPETAFSSHHDSTVKPNQVHQCRKRILDASQGVREPSKSERNGWLKRKRVHFAVADEDEGRLSVLAKTESVNGS